MKAESEATHTKRCQYNTKHVWFKAISLGHNPNASANFWRAFIVGAEAGIL